MTIPKRIWAVWLDFTNKADGKFNRKMRWFKNRIYMLHPEWTVTILSKWDELLRYVSEDELIMKLLDNPYVLAAHKSDSIRLFLLHKFGGFWVDISTFLICPLDIYLEKQPSASFICYYSDHSQVESMILNPLSSLIDSVPYHTLIRKMKDIQSNYITLKAEYKQYTFMPENWFIACVPDHPIIRDCISQLSKFWFTSLPKITNEELLCVERNKYTSKLATELFTIHYLDYNITQIFHEANFTNQSYFNKLLGNTWGCAYLMMYLQMYKALVTHIKKTGSSVKNERGNTLESKFEKDLCSSSRGINMCKNIIIRNNATDGSVYMLSYPYNKLIKWQDKMENRVSSHNTLIERKIESIHSDATGKRMLAELVAKGIYQVKFSAWTRNSPIIDKLILKFPNRTTRSRRIRKRRTVKKHGHMM